MTTYIDTATSDAQAIAREGYLTFVAYAFLLFTVVGIHPFTAPDFKNHIPLDQVLEGDPWHRAVVILFFLMALSAMPRRWPQIREITKYNLLVAVILAWCLLSSMWAIVPLVGLRGGVALVFTTFISTVIATLRPSRFLDVLVWVTGTYMVVDYVGVLGFPGPSTINYEGAWVGMHSLKNAAGQNSAIAAMVWFVIGMARSSLFLLGGAALWSAFLVMSLSKTSIALMVVLLPLYFVLRSTIRRGAATAMLAAILISLLVIIPLGLFLSSWIWMDAFGGVTFTGRTFIWDYVWGKILQSPFVGWGYNSFWFIGNLSPAHYEGTYKDADIIVESHNGYLDLLLTTGIVGFVLTVVFMIRPIVLLFRRDYTVLPNEQQTALCVFLILLIFNVLHNTMESSFLLVGNSVWSFALPGMLLLSEWNAKIGRLA